MSGTPKGKFPKSAHLLKNADFQRVYKQGRRHFSGSMTVFYLLRVPVASVTGSVTEEGAQTTPADGVRFGFTVPRALGGAVDRNRIRRRVREAVRRNVAELEGMQGLDVVFNPKRTARDAEFTALSGEVARAFQVIRRSVISSARESGAVRPQQAR